MKREMTFEEKLIAIIEKYSIKSDDTIPHMEIIECKGKRIHTDFDLRELNRSLLNRSLQS